MKGRWYASVARAGGVFALAFTGCVVGLPLAGVALSCAFGPALLLVYVPCYVLWLGHVWVDRADGAEFVPDAEGYHAVPLVVWLVTWAAFSLAARNARPLQQTATALGAITLVTVGTHVVMRYFGVRLDFDVL